MSGDEVAEGEDKHGGVRFAPRERGGALAAEGREVFVRVFPA